VNAEQKGIKLGAALDNKTAFAAIASTTKTHRVESILYRWISSTENNLRVSLLADTLRIAICR
jgi:hypothetical protein